LCFLLIFQCVEPQQDILCSRMKKKSKQSNSLNLEKQYESPWSAIPSNFTRDK